MATEVIMPQLGLTMESGRIVEWHKREGDPVRAGEVLVTIETDKSIMEVEAKSSGVLLKILRQAGEEVPITELIGYLGEAGETVPVPAAQIEATAPRQEPARSAGSVPAVTRGGRVKASPAARQQARRLNVPLEQVIGTGPGGRIVKDDVQAYAATMRQPAGPAQPVTPVTEAGVGRRVKQSLPLSGKRRVAAQRLTQSKAIAPHFYLTMAVDMSKMVEYRASLLKMGPKARADHQPLRVTYNDLLIKAVALALVDFPLLNASLDGDTIVCYEDINVGFAVAVPDGLVVPVIRDANRKSVLEIAEEARGLENKAHENLLAPDDYSLGTFTISNLGMFGVDEFTAIINPPQVAILAVGQIQKQPLVIDDKVAIHTMMKMTLSTDHRVVDGALGAQFVARVREILENPIALFVS